MEYTLIYFGPSTNRYTGGWNMQDFERKVTSMMQEGWKPQGGICVTGLGETVRYYQAMVRETPTDKPLNS